MTHVFICEMLCRYVCSNFFYFLGRGKGVGERLFFLNNMFLHLLGVVSIPGIHKNLVNWVN